MTMTTSEQLELELDHLLAGGGVTSGHLLQLAASGGRVECHLVALDSIGCSLQEVRWIAARQYSPTELQSIADWICRQVRYLVEPLRVIETDEEGTQLQIRSDPPTRHPQASVYFEAVVDSSGVALRRYSAPPGTPRQVIAMQLTREVLGRLVGDLAEAPQHAKPCRP
jgi:hypothetical protein